MDDTKYVVLRVSSTKNPDYVKKVAGAISWQLRDNGFCKMRAVKTDAVNNAIKALAIVNQRVSRAGLKFAMNVTFRAADGNRESTAIEMTINEVSSARPEEFVEYKVSGKIEDTDVATRLAGAIAIPVRQNKYVRLRCIGPSAVYRAITACCIAKGYVYANGLNAMMVPSWSSLPSEDPDKPVSLIQIDFWADKLP